MGITRRRLILSGAGVAAIGALTALVVRDRTRTPVAELEYPAAAVHRLGKVRTPENTLAAARTSLRERPGVILECDVHALSDGTLVVNHDETIDRVASNGESGRVQDMTADQWRALRIEHPDGGASEPALFVDELFAEYAETGQILLVELKAPQAMDQFIDAVRPLRGQIIVQSFDDEVTRSFTRAGLSALQLVSGTSHPDVVDGVYAVGMHLDRISHETASRITATGAHLWTWGAGLVAHDPEYTRLGVEGFLIDDPAL